MTGNKIEVVDSITCDSCGGSHFSIPVYNDGETEVCCTSCGEPLDRDLLVEKLEFRLLKRCDGK